VDSTSTAQSSSAPARPLHRWWRNPYPWIVLVLGLLALVLTVPAPVANDIRYEAGTHFVSTHSVAETFSHRPLLHRFVTEAVFRPTWIATGTDRVAFEMLLRVEAFVLSVLACAALWVGLRRRVPRLASPVSVAALAGLVLCSTGIAWEPDWLAVVFTVAGVGLAFLRRPVGPILAGIAFAIAAALKFVTLPVALIGLLAVLLMDQPGSWEAPRVRVLRQVRELPARHPRFLVALLSATVTGTTWVILNALVWPWEIRWLLDASQMQPRRPFLDNIGLTFELIGNSMIMWPAMALVPAALVRASRTEKIVVWGALLLAWIPVPAQQQYFPYHMAAFPVIGSLALVMGVRRGGTWLAGYALVGALGSVVVLTQIPPDTRVAWVWPMIAVWVAYAAVGAIVQRRRIQAFPEVRTRAHSAFAALVTVLCLVPVSLPAAGWSVTMDPSRYFSTEFSIEENKALFQSGEDIRATIGPDTPVLYLAFGDQVYAVGNPTYCTFPTNVFTQRGEWEQPILSTETYADNLACLDDPRNKYVIWDQDFVTYERQPQAVLDRIERNFDCSGAKTYNVLTVCPRR